MTSFQAALTEKATGWRGSFCFTSWRTSSTLYACHPDQHNCGGFTTDIFFSTAEDDSPWIEYDLGGHRSFSSLAVGNRVDCCQERAFPMVVEVSDDRTSWRKIAEQPANFDVWRPSFPRERARYLRLRVTKRSFLHLDAVAAYR